MADGAHAVDWPPHIPRHPPGERERTSKFSVTRSKAFSDLERELKRIGVDDYRYSFGCPSRKTDGRPYADASVDDPGFVLRWTMGGDQYAAGCDRYTDLRSNVRAVGKWLNEKRLMENRPVETGSSEFTTAKLPPAPGESNGGDDAELKRRKREAQEDPYGFLEVPKGSPDMVVKAAIRAKKKKYHPDSGDEPNKPKFIATSVAEEAINE